ncbi:MAG: IS3 family transposase [bacterium]|jgi:transposase InsO family protein|nr:IS3 family transposase [bacterium]
MFELKGKYKISEMAKYLKVSVSGYYSWLKSPESNKAKEDELIKNEMKIIFDDSRKTYGASRIMAKLLEKGFTIGKHRCARLIKELGLVPVAKKKFKKTTDSDHDLPYFENLLDQDFESPAPNVVWVGDITYIKTLEGWLYLAVVIDLYSKKVVGWAISERMTADLVVKAFEMAVSRRIFTELFLIFHTDRGSQYCSDKFKESVKQASKKLGIRIYQSMSSTGNCYDNAVAESFFHTLKVEWINRFIFRTREVAKRAIFDYLECFYNRKRIHSSIGYKNPQQMEDEYYFKNLRTENVG